MLLVQGLRVFATRSFSLNATSLFNAGFSNPGERKRPAQKRRPKQIGGRRDPDEEERNNEETSKREGEEASSRNGARS